MAVIVLGSWAELQDVTTGERVHYRLVNPADANPAEGRLSIESPVGSSLVGRGTGETVEVATPRGKRRLLISAAG